MSKLCARPCLGRSLSPRPLSPRGTAQYSLTVSPPVHSCSDFQLYENNLNNKEMEYLLVLRIFLKIQMEFLNKENSSCHKYNFALKTRWKRVVYCEGILFFLLKYLRTLNFDNIFLPKLFLNH